MTQLNKETKMENMKRENMGDRERIQEACDWTGKREAELRFVEAGSNTRDEEEKTRG